MSFDATNDISIYAGQVTLEPEDLLFSATKNLDVRR